MRGLFGALGVDLPDDARVDVPARCFANADGHSHGDRRPSAVVNVESGVWFCHACGAKGGAYDAALALDRTPAQAMELLERFGFTDANSPAPRPPEPRCFEAQVERLQAQLSAAPQVRARLTELRNWTDKAIRELGLGFDGSRIVFPHRDRAGKVVGLARYQPNPDLRGDAEPKMKADAGSKRELFPPPETVPDDDRLFLVEGEPDAVAGVACGMRVVAIPGAQNWRSEWAARFTGREVVLVPDCDNPGRSAMEQVARDLSAVGVTVRILDLASVSDGQEGFDLSDYLKDARTDEERHQAFDLLDQATDSTPVFLSAPKEESRVERKNGLPFRPMAEALRDAPDEPNYIWRGYLAKGAITLLAAVPKGGKTTLLFGLCKALEAGGTFIGQPCAAAGVLLLTEERESTLNEKFKRFNLNGSVHSLMRHEARSKSWNEIIDEAVTYCRDEGLSVLIVDTWDKWAGLRGDQENSSGSVTEALAPLMWAASQGLVVVIVTHQRKSGGSHGEAVRGSNALTGGVDVILEIERVSADIDPAARVLRAESRFGGTPHELVARLVEDRYEACGDVAAVHAQAEKERLRSLLPTAEDDAALASDLADASDMHASTARKRLNEMVNDDAAVQRIGKGRKGSAHRFFLSTRGHPLGVERNKAAGALRIATPDEESFIDHVDQLSSEPGQ